MPRTPLGLKKQEVTLPGAEVQIHPDQVPRLSSRGGVRLREDTVYTNDKGKEQKGVRKRAEKFLDKLEETLARILEPEEVVFYVARCQAPVGALEQFAFGWYIYYVTGTVLVFTNLRILHLLVRRDGSWKRSLRSVRWGDLAEARMKGWLSPQLWLKYRNGKQEKYWGLRRDDAGKIKGLVAVLLPGSLGGGSAAQAMVSLCPDCLGELTPLVYQCAKCSLTFKDETTMVRRSLFIPGGGYFYTGHWFLGVGDFIAEAYLLILALVYVLVGLGVMAEPLEPGEEPVEAGAAWFIAGFLAVILVVEKLFTIHHCRRFVRNFIPTR